MKYILVFLLMTTPVLAMAGLTGCGEYEVRGIVRSDNSISRIVVNEKTMSEIIINLPSGLQLKLLPYINRPVTITLILDKKFDGTKGSTQKIINVKSRIPDPLKPGDTGFMIKNKMECKK